MKKIVLALCLMVGLAACTTHQKPCNRRPAPRPEPVMAQPVAQPVVQQNAQPCCQGKSYTVSEPVEVVYKNTTYNTVYEPKTFTTTTFVKKPYTCNSGNCQQRMQAPTVAQ